MKWFCGWIGVAAIGAALFGGCIKQPPAEKQVPVSNKGYEVEQLFTDQRGVSIYRFYDMGDWRYYAIGADGAAHMLPTTTRRETTTAGTDSGVLVVPHGHEHGGGHGGK